MSHGPPRETDEGKKALGIMALTHPTTSTSRDYYQCTTRGLSCTTSAPRRRRTYPGGASTAAPGRIVFDEMVVVAVICEGDPAFVTWVRDVLVCGGEGRQD